MPPFFCLFQQDTSVLGVFVSLVLQVPWNVFEPNKKNSKITVRSEKVSGAMEYYVYIYIYT